MSHAERAEIVARTAFARDWEQLAHTVRVVNNLGEATDEEFATAWLHDVIEDTQVDFIDLQDMGFPASVIEAVTLLTRGYGTDYQAYKEKLLSTQGLPGRIARRVKLADARDNLARCAAAKGVPKWERLAKTRYQPLVVALEARIG